MYKLRRSTREIDTFMKNTNTQNSAVKSILCKITPCSTHVQVHSQKCKPKTINMIDFREMQT
jgi:hypothetical protein